MGNVKLNFCQNGIIAVGFTHLKNFKHKMYETVFKYQILGSTEQCSLGEGKQMRTKKLTPSTRNKIIPKHIRIKFLKTCGNGKFSRLLKLRDTEKQR